METLQLIAHFLLLGDIIIFVTLLLKGISYVFTKLLSILALTLAIAFILFFISYMRDYSSFEELSAKIK